MSASPSDSRPYTIEVRRRAVGTVESVMRLVLDPSTWHDWQPEIVSATGPAPLTPGRVVHGHARMMGFRDVQGRSTTLRAAEDFFEEDVIVGVRMRLTYSVRQVGREVEVIRTLQAYLPRGFLGTLLSVLLKRRMRKMQESVVERLLDQSEAPAAAVSP